MPCASTLVRTRSLLRFGMWPSFGKIELQLPSARVGLGDDALRARVARELHGRRDPAQGVVHRGLVEPGQGAVVRVLEPDRPRLRQVQLPPAVREVRGDDPAEREPEVARSPEVRLHTLLRPRTQIRQPAADRAQRRLHARLDVDRPGARGRDVGLPARVDHDAALPHRVPHELVQLVVARVLAVAVHHHGERSGARPRPDRLEHEPGVVARAARADTPAAVGVVAAARPGLGLRRLGDRRGSRRREERGRAHRGHGNEASHLPGPGANCG